MTAALRFSVVATLAIGVAGCATSPGPHQPKAAAPIFRVVTVGDGHQTIALGAPLDDAVKPLMTQSQPNKFSLRKSGFGGADTITGDLTPQGCVRAIFFTYPSGTEYSKKVEAYRRMLGEPLQDPAVRSDGSRATRWQDADTLFEVEEDQSAVRTAMYDRRSAASCPAR